MKNDENSKWNDNSNGFDMNITLFHTKLRWT